MERGGTLSDRTYYWDAAFWIDFQPDPNSDALGTIGNDKGFNVGDPHNPNAPRPLVSEITARWTATSFPVDRYVQLRPYLTFGSILDYHLLLDVRGPNGQSIPCGPEWTGGPSEAADYRVEVRAWIPHQEVPPTLRANSPPSNCYQGLDVADWFFRYLGDGHAAYQGSVRVKAVLSFRWDGERITQPSGGVTVSPSIAKYRAFDGDGNFLGFCNDYGLGAGGGDQNRAEAKTDTTFELEFDAHNSLAAFSIPAINALVKGQLEHGGRVLRLAWSTDGFPSHGIEVLRNGQTLFRSILKDVSCLDVFAPSDFPVGFAGLTFRNNSGGKDLVVDGNPVIADSPECQPAPPPTP